MSFFSRKTAALTLSVLLLLCSSCAVNGKGDGEPEMFMVNGEMTYPDTPVATYEVFVYSFCDSDGDGIGDLKGVISKLDYIKELGFTRIWLMPVMPSPTYHKYDVTDYCDIDPEYGTMEDMDKLISECDQRGMELILDLTLNHTSSEHPWFTQAVSYLEGLEDGQEADASVCPYVDYYNFETEPGSSYYKAGTSDFYYEAQFWSGMPDLNLSNPDVRDELLSVADYWLDKGIDGFRLDATTYYMTGSPEGNIEFMSWFSDAIKAEHPDAYLVGEAWTDYGEYVNYYQSGIDSFFNFMFAGKDGVIANSVNGTSSRGAASYGYGQQLFYDKLMESYGDMIVDAPFLSNHDMARASGYFTSSDASQYKIAQAMSLLMSGNVFLYYGDEIGMSGSGRDENFRLPMYWTADDSSESAEIMCKGPADADRQDMRYPALDEQIEDDLSIYSFIRQTMIIRNSHPAICYGLPEYMEELSGNDVCVIAKSYGDENLLLVFNVSESEQVLDLSSYADLSVEGMLQTSEDAPSLDGNEAVMAPRSVLILSY